MRRTLSIILFIIGGWMLAGGIMMTGFDFGFGMSMMLGMAGVMAGIAAPFLLLATFASPGNRLCDLGMTLMITAVAGGGTAATMWSMASDPNFKRMMPPNQQLPKFELALIPASAAVLTLAAAGFGLWLLGRSREQRQKPDFQRIFGDD